MTRRTACTLGLIALFLFAGLTGHDPWKQDETYSFGIIYHFYTAHSWLVPTNAGAPFMEKPPLYYWSAVLMCRLLGGLLPLHDAARLTSLLYMALTTLFMWKAARVLFAGRADRDSLSFISVALLLGATGLVRHAHDMFTDVALLTGATITLYGMASLIRMPQRWHAAGLWFGLGMGVAFLSKGVFVPGVLGISALALWALLPELHTRYTWRAIGVALLAASPFMLIWPMLLYHHSPELFRVWFWDNNIGRFLGFTVGVLGAENTPFYFLWITPLFAFPAFPLALAEAVTGRRAWRRAEYLLPVMISVVGMAALFASASGRALYLLPLLPAFALLGAQGLLRIPAFWLRGWNYALGGLFSAAIAVIWLVWWELLHPGMGGPLLRMASRWLPVGYVPQHGQVFACAVAASLTLLWFISWRIAENAPAHAARLWLAGVAALWGCAMTLWLPWIDATCSYRGLLADMHAAAEKAAPGRCVAAFELGESIAPMLEYMDGTAPVAHGFNATQCPLLVTVAWHEDAQNPAHGWKLIWKGSRLLDEKNEELRLYQRY